jgi:hypothetical protein
MIEAYRVAGRELSVREKAIAHEGTTGQFTRGSPEVPRLDDLGITKKQSSEWQTLALLSAGARERSPHHSGLERSPSAARMKLAAPAAFTVAPTHSAALITKGHNLIVAATAAPNRRRAKPAFARVMIEAYRKDGTKLSRASG